jgi:hypothetical protein
MSAQRVRQIKWVRHTFVRCPRCFSTLYFTSELGSRCRNCGHTEDEGGEVVRKEELKPSKVFDNEDSKLFDSILTKGA